ncbi:MAG TPA: hypothetical protein DD381_14275 [Lentisphaeria bacterium]|nr:MAG: hypothetical protein A2X47_00990 [Lentisphaerae bacterium GWF2_38_69]HBM17491.1 hypothetical protein [Lentisphaeria bacterium]
MIRFYKNLTFGQKLLVSTLLGLFFGLFFGHRCSVLEPLNQLFVRLFQIAIIPYLIFTIIQSVGSIHSSHAKNIGISIIKTAVFLWATSIIFILVFYFALPAKYPIGFFRPESVNGISNEIDMLSLFIPSNPFFSISQGHVPAIVIFCLLIGIVLINEKNKHPFLAHMEFASHIMKKVNDIIMVLLPFGILIMSSYMFGTIGFDILKGIMMYLLLSVEYLIVMSVFVLPGIILCTNDISIKRLISLIFPAALIAFATGNVFLALPVIYQSLYKFDEEKIRKHDLDTTNIRTRQNYINIIVPLAWSFPGTYKFLIIFFIIFEKWDYGQPATFIHQFFYYIVGIPVLFGNTSVIVPYLLKITNLPEQTYNYFHITSNILVYLNNACGAVFIITFTVLCCLLINKEFSIRPKKLLAAFSISAIVFITAAISIREVLKPVLLQNNLNKDLGKMELQFLNFTYPKDIKYEIMSKNPDTIQTGNIYDDNDVFDGIINSHILKVAFRPNKWPFCYVRKNGDLVGYDIDNIFDMADNLNCQRIEFYPINNLDDLKKLQDAGYEIDIAIGGFWLWSAKSNISYSMPYMKMHIAAVIRSKDTKLFPDFKSVINNKKITYGVLKDNNMYETLSLFVNPKKIVILESESDFYEKNLSDVLITDAESACATNIIYSDFRVLTIQGKSNWNGFFAYPTPEKKSDKFRDFVNSWIAGNTIDETLNQRYKYWIEGRQNNSNHKERWSILGYLNQELKSEIKFQLMEKMSPVKKKNIKYNQPDDNDNNSEIITQANE